jgi:hypothetical protein
MGGYALCCSLCQPNIRAGTEWDAKPQEGVEKKLALDMITPQCLLQYHEREAVSSVLCDCAIW